MTTVIAVPQLVVDDLNMKMKNLASALARWDEVWHNAARLNDTNALVNADEQMIEIRYEMSEIEDDFDRQGIPHHKRLITFAE